MNLKLIVLILLPLSVMAQPRPTPPDKPKPKWNPVAMSLGSKFVYTCPRCDTAQTNNSVVISNSTVKLTCANCKLTFVADLVTNLPPAQPKAAKAAKAKKPAPHVTPLPPGPPTPEDTALPYPPGFEPSIMPPVPPNLPPTPPSTPAPTPMAPAPLAPPRAATYSGHTLPQAISVETLLRMAEHQGNQNYVYDTDYVVVCQKCYQRQTLKPTKIIERTTHAVNGGYEVERILDFKCPLCKTKFVAFDTAFAPVVKATKVK